jgi:uncharacterized tellurite resistance protein B-like protein
MNVGELGESDQVVLLALVGLMARADGQVSDGEMQTLRDLREAIGENFERVRDLAATLDGPSAILKAAADVTRPEARDAIFHVLVGMALPDTIPETEADLFRRLATLWGLESPL